MRPCPRQKEQNMTKPNAQNLCQASSKCRNSFRSIVELLSWSNLLNFSLGTKWNYYDISNMIIMFTISIPKQNNKTINISRVKYDAPRLLEDLPSNALIWEGPIAPILPRNAVQRSELLGRKKQSLCCLCHQKLVSPCHHSFKKMGVQGIGDEFVWLTWAQTFALYYWGSRFQNSEHHSVSLLEPTWKILSTFVNNLWR